MPRHDGDWNYRLSFAVKPAQLLTWDCGLDCRQVLFRGAHSAAVVARVSAQAHPGTLEPWQATCSQGVVSARRCIFSCGTSGLVWAHGCCFVVAVLLLLIRCCQPGISSILAWPSAHVPWPPLPLTPPASLVAIRVPCNGRCVHPAVCSASSLMCAALILPLLVRLRVLVSVETCSL